jgi:hypothetical protein
MYDWLTPGTVFDTNSPDGQLIERGCVVATMPDDRGNFDAYDSDGVLCAYNVDMVDKGENYWGQHNS